MAALLRQMIPGIEIRLIQTLPADMVCLAADSNDSTILPADFFMLHGPNMDRR